MVELKDFVAETLKQVVEGVKAAQEAVAEHGATINPRTTGGSVSQIDFDVAVTTTDSDKVQGRIGILLGNLGVGAGGSTEKQSSAANRIRFSVPVVLPHTD